MKVLKVDFTSPNAPTIFCESFKDTGFAVIEHPPINKTLIHEIYAEWRDFFENADKEKYLFHRETQDGFFPKEISETAKNANLKDIKEFFQYYPWGQYPKELSDKTQQLYQSLTSLAATLLSWAELGLPDTIKSALTMPLSQMIQDSQQTMLRILHYPPFEGNEPKGAIRAAAHEDINLITLLVSATAPGLQVKNIHGEWFDVPCVEDSIVVNVGDMLALATQNYYRSTTHQVVNPSEENLSRLSMPLFLHPRPEVFLSPSKTAGQYLNERLIELGVK